MRAISNGGFALIDFASILAEEADLERKLEAVRLMKAAYGVGSGVTTVAPLAVERAKPVARKSRDLSDRMDKFGLYGQHIIDSALLMLPGADHNPLPTRNLVTMLETIGVDIRGENKVNALSALLARSTKIKGHGRSGCWQSPMAKPTLTRFYSTRLRSRPAGVIPWTAPKPVHKR
jgi:hypothetical protein